MDISAILSMDGDKNIMKIFAKKEDVRDIQKENNYVCGVFFAGSSEDVSEYNRKIMNFLAKFSDIYYEMLRIIIQKKRLLDDKEKEEFHKRIEDLSKTFSKFLTSERNIKLEDIKFEAIRTFKKEKETLSIEEEAKEFNIYFAFPSRDRNGDVILYYIDRDLKPDIEKIYEDFANGNIGEADLREKMSRLNSLACLEIIDEVLSLKDCDEEIRRFFEKLKELIELSESDPIAKEVIRKLLRIDVSVYLGITEEDSNDGAFICYKPIINRFGYITTKLSALEAMKSIAKKEEIKDLIGTQNMKEDELIESLKEEMEQLGVYEWFVKLYEDENFLKKIKIELSKLLKGNTERIKKVVFKRMSRPLYTVTKRIETEKTEFFVLFEKEVRDEASKFIRIFKSYDNRYLRMKRISERVYGEYIETFFPEWEKFKRLEPGIEGKYSHNNSVSIATFLIQFAGFVEALKRLENERGKNLFIIAVLDVDPEEETYSVWNLVRIFLDFLIVKPFQTVTRRVLENVLNAGNHRKITPFLKNIVLSGLRERKHIVLEFKNFKTEEEKTYHLLVENRTQRLADGSAYYMYVKYALTFRDNTLRIRKEGRPFFIFADETSGDKKDLIEFIERQKNVILISGDVSSPAWNLIHPSEKNKYFVFYREIKTPYIMRRSIDRDAFIISEKDFKIGIQHIGLLKEKEIKDSKLFVIRAPLSIPKHLQEEPYASITLSLFFVRGLKGESFINESEVLLSLLGWLIWESEAFLFLYSKPKFVPVKVPKLQIHTRGDKGRIYTIPVSTSLFELAYLIERWEAKDRIIKD